jgi:hypothetical protein
MGGHRAVQYGTFENQRSSQISPPRCRIVGCSFNFVLKEFKIQRLKRGLDQSVSVAAASS